MLIVTIHSRDLVTLPANMVNNGLEAKSRFGRINNCKSSKDSNRPYSRRSLSSNSQMDSLVVALKLVRNHFDKD